MSTTVAQAAPNATYTLGSSPDELIRLQRQGDIYADITLMAMRQAGIASGMRVIDAGSGAGDVAFLAADLIGPNGAVTGIEQSPVALANARDRARQTGRSNVTFVEGDVEVARLGGVYDALVGRLILMHTRQPVAVLRNLASQLRPGAPILFLEIDIPAAVTSPSVPLFEQMRGLCMDAFEVRGVSNAPGWDLREQFVAAGLPEPSLLYLGRIDSAPARAVCLSVVGVIRSLLPIIEAKGLAKAAELDLDTLADRLAAALSQRNAQVMYPPLVAAISHAR
jgi:SAM-dependent methyltransferase